MSRPTTPKHTPGKARGLARRARKAGLPPGTLVHVGEKKTDRVRLTILDYDAEHFEERQLGRVQECFNLKATPTVSWINVDGLHESETIEQLGEAFEIHPLVLEDVLHTQQRPKFEDHEKRGFIVLRMLRHDEPSGAVDSEQVSLVLGPNFVISFQEREGDVFDPIRDRIRQAKGRIRKMGADYLAYTLLDAVVDGYFAVLETLGERIETLEQELMDHPTQRTLAKIHALKREMISLRRSIWPLREAISGVQRSESSLISKATGVYLRDVYDHTVQVIDTVESFRDIVAGMLDTYLSSLSNKMNNIMKVLTIIATLFIPLTFIAGIYGMNFEHMPELKWRWGYLAVWIVMGVVACGMLLYFRRKKWL